MIKVPSIGWSKGGELSLLLAATFPQFKIAIGCVPSAVVFQGLRSEQSNTSSWSFHGSDLPYVPVLDAEPYDKDAWEQVHYNIKNHLPVSFTPGHLAGLRHKAAVEKATIPVEKIQGPVLVISGTDDQVWPSTILSDMVIARLAQHRHPYPYKHLRYEVAGHTIGIPYQPTTITETNFGQFKMALGGTPQANAFARHDSWPQVLSFLAQRLQS
jgi:dienelactone hydrolase